jgi:hypothetical protein
MGLTISSFFYDTKESFRDPLRPERPPLFGSQGLQALNLAEEVDGYRKAVSKSKINTTARIGNKYMPALYGIYTGVPPADLSQPWPNGQVIWMDPTADSGLPHTRAPNFICLPYNIDVKTLPSTLLHERIHVSQRLHPKEWNALLEDVWDIKPWFGSFPSKVEERRRINPDLFDAPLYIWKNTWVSIGLFKSLKSPVLSEIDIVWWDVTTRTIHNKPPEEWLDFFGNHPAGEHPYEIAAYILSSNPTQNKAYDAIKSRVNDLPTTEV